MLYEFLLEIYDTMKLKKGCEVPLITLFYCRRYVIWKIENVDLHTVNE